MLVKLVTEILIDVLCLIYSARRTNEEIKPGGPWSPGVPVRENRKRLLYMVCIIDKCV